MNFFSFLFLALSFLFISPKSYPSNLPIAKVIKIRGKVTKLLPGAIDASVVSLGDEFIEDTSIVTDDKSFVQVKFVDNSILSLGPRSKIVVNSFVEGKPGIISLLKGRIRTEVEKSKDKGSDKNKFYIRTRTAAMGVRGTDFQTIYNPDNRVTSLLTFKGSVAFTKIDAENHEAIESQTKVISRDVQSNDLLIANVEGAPISENVQLQKILNQNETVEVLAGQNAFTSEHFSKSSKPVKISTAQLNALFKNTEFKEKNILNLNPETTDRETKSTLPTVDQAFPTEGFYQKETNDFAPRAGGFIDLNTGLYIAPESSSSFDSMNKIYLAKNMGDIDKDTGEYFPPNGIVLNPVKGFIVPNQDIARVELIAKREDLNKALSKDIVLAEESQSLVDKGSLKTRDEKFIRNYLSLSLALGSYQTQINKNSNVPYVEGQNSSIKNFKIEYQSSSKSRLTSVLGISFAKINYNLVGENIFLKNTNSLWSLASGLKYSFNDSFNILGKLSFEQKEVAETSSTSPFNIQISKLTLTNLSLGGQYSIFEFGDFIFQAEVNGSFSFRKKVNTLIVNNYKSYDLYLTPVYKMDDKKSLALSVYLKNDFFDVSNGLGKNTQEHADQGLEIKFIQSF